LIFRTTDGSEAARIHHALWFQERFNYASFQVNTMRRLLIVVEDAYHNGYRTIRDEREHEARYPPLDYVIIDDRIKEYRVDITLIVDNSVMPTLMYRWVLDPFEFKPIPQ
jgi:hypothetical protein